MAIQKANLEQVGLLSSHFQKRYEPNFAWKSACAAFQALPGLRGFWPMSAVDDSGDAIDQSGHGMTMTATYTPLFGYDGLMPYAEYNGTQDYHRHADHALFDIIGSESYVASDFRGLTVLGWWYFDSASDDDAMINKWQASDSDDKAYQLVKETSDDQYVFRVSSDGTAETEVVSSVTPVASTWIFAAGRYDPGAELAIFINKTKDTNTTSIPATINNSAASLSLGYDDGVLDYLNGKASLVAVCCQMLSDAIIQAVYQQTRAGFGA